MRPCSILLGLLVLCVTLTAALPADAQQYGPWTNAGLPPASLSTVLGSSVDNLARNGTSERVYVGACASLANGQQTVSDPNRLPVGNGWWINCWIAPSFFTIERTVQGTDGSHWCWKGAAVQYRTMSDPSLRVQVSPGAPGQTWWLQASGNASYITPISVPGGRTWPIALEVWYGTASLVPMQSFSGNPLTTCVGVHR